MTSIWGPLGWMTLHSAASLYPDSPTDAERQLMTRWLDLFRDTITCPSCQGHFAELLGEYRTRYPNMLYSRREFLLFTFRAHNSVNRRLNKPVYSTVQACFDILRTNVKFNKSYAFRISYVNHITRHWKMFRDASGMAALKRIIELRKIEAEYMTPRSNEFETIIPEDNVMQTSGQSHAEVQPMARSGGRLVMTATGFRIRR